LNDVLDRADNIICNCSNYGFGRLTKIILYEFLLPCLNEN